MARRKLGPPDSLNHARNNANGTAQKLEPSIANDAVNGPLKELSTILPTEQPGLTQLFICVAGIYASLYDPRPYLPKPSTQLLNILLLVSLGLFSKNV